jgi:hypothetical protein
MLRLSSSSATGWMPASARLVRASPGWARPVVAWAAPAWEVLVASLIRRFKLSPLRVQWFEVTSTSVCGNFMCHWYLRINDGDKLNWICIENWISWICRVGQISSPLFLALKMFILLKAVGTIPSLQIIPCWCKFNQPIISHLHDVSPASPINPVTYRGVCFHNSQGNLQSGAFQNGGSTIFFWGGGSTI